MDGSGIAVHSLYYEFGVSTRVYGPFGNLLYQYDYLYGDGDQCCFTKEIFNTDEIDKISNNFVNVYIYNFSDLKTPRINSFLVNKSDVNDLERYNLDKNKMYFITLTDQQGNLIETKKVFLME